MSGKLKTYQLIKAAFDLLSLDSRSARVKIFTKRSRFFFETKWQGRRSWRAYHLLHEIHPKFSFLGVEVFEVGQNLQKWAFKFNFGNTISCKKRIALTWGSFLDVIKKLKKIARSDSRAVTSARALYDNQDLHKEWCHKTLSHWNSGIMLY